jgi:DNA-binding NarL/FixJ family response regulator
VVTTSRTGLSYDHAKRYGYGDKGALGERNADIARRVAEGERMSDVARSLGLTPQRVGQIVRARREEARDP